MNWYYKDGNTEMGPLSNEALRALIKDGTVQATTQVRQEGTAEWALIDPSEFSPESPLPSPSPPQPIESITSFLVFRRIAAFVADLACIVLLSATYGLIHHAVTDVAWDFNFTSGFLIFSILWFVLNLSFGVSPGRWLMGVTILREGKALTSFPHLLLRWMFAWIPIVFFLNIFADNYLGCMGLIETIKYTLYSYELDEPLHVKWGILYFILPFYFILHAFASMIRMFVTKGKEGIHDILGSHAALPSSVKITGARVLTVIALVAVASVLQIIGFRVGFLSRFYYSQEGHYSVELPGAPYIFIREDGIKIGASGFVGGFYTGSGLISS